MSLKPQTDFTIPKLTVRVAAAAFPKGNIYLSMRNELGVIYRDEALAHLFPQRGQPSLAPWRLALITIMQFIEGLTDRQANVDLIGPPPGDSQWQSRAGKGFGLADFYRDWDSKVVQCPLGKSSSTWKERLNQIEPSQ